jgi:hypothetical protein
MSGDHSESRHSSSYLKENERTHILTKFDVVGDGGRVVDVELRNPRCIHD